MINQTTEWPKEPLKREKYTFPWKSTEKYAISRENQVSVMSRSVLNDLIFPIKFLVL